MSETTTINHRRTWTTNDDGVPVPRRTTGSAAHGYTSDDFTLVCRACGDDFGNEPDLPVGVIGAHFNKHHPGSLQVHLDLLWLGQGPAPTPEGE